MNGIWRWFGERRRPLPLATGIFDPEAKSGSLTQAGGLRLISSVKEVALRQLRFDSSAKSLTANVAGKRVRLAHLGGAGLQRNGFDARLKATRLPLTRAAAATLNRVLGLPKLLRAGLSLGSASGLGAPSEIPIAFGKIAMGGPDTAFSTPRRRRTCSCGARASTWPRENSPPRSARSQPTIR